MVKLNISKTVKNKAFTHKHMTHNYYFYQPRNEVRS